MAVRVEKVDLPGIGFRHDVVTSNGRRISVVSHRDGAREIQLDLILSYRTNVALYPEFQQYFREHRPPLLAAWGRHDLAFLPAGAEAYRRDLPDAEIHLLDTGHFALESHHKQIANLMLGFLPRHLTAD